MRDRIRTITGEIIFPMILLLLPMAGYNLGTDISDTTYSLGNYMYLNTLGAEWKYATFIANITGRFLLTAAGGRMMVMNALSSLIISATALIVYYGFRKRISSAVLFICEAVAISLCWCPQVILYNYLTYLLLTLGAYLIYKAIVADRYIYSLLAGVCLGINMFVRIANAIEVILIVVLWYGICITGEKGKIMAKQVRHTLNAICGFLAGAGASVLIMIISGGASGIHDMMSWVLKLLSSDGEAGGYSMGAMLRNIVINYIGNSYWVLFMLVGMGLGLAGFAILKGRFVLLKKFGYTACVAILFVYFFRNGIFTTEYYNTGAIFRLSVIAMYFMYIICIYALFSNIYEKEEKLLALMSIMLLLITPIGSNNHLFTIINNMFIVLPVSASLMLTFLKHYNGSAVIFPVKCMMAVFGGVFLFQSLLFGFEYVFMDSEKGESRDCTIECDCNMKGMHTNAANKAAIEGLVTYLDETADKKLLLYGNVPGVCYVTNRSCAIATTWPDLESYGNESFAEDIEGLKEYPVIVIGAKVYNDMEDSDGIKEQLLIEYMSDNNYYEAYANDGFVVLERE